MTLRIDRMIHLRGKFGMKQNALADALDMSPNQISKYERGQANPSLETLAQMAELFNTTTDYLLGLSNVPHPGAEPDAEADLTQDEIEWLALYRERSSTDRKQLFTVLRALRDMRSEES